jgi:predicted kinase
VARRLDAVHLRIDSIEHALRQSGIAPTIEDAGYRVGYAVAEGSLRLGRTVVADSVNPWPLTRDAWADVAERAGCPAIEIELICSDVDEHRQRIERRSPDIPVFRLPTWQKIVERDYRTWDRRFSRSTPVA